MSVNSNSNSKQRLVAILAAAIIALLIGNGYLLYKNSTNNSLIEKQTSELDEAEKVKAELEKQYYEAMSSLEEMRGKNVTLDKQIEEQKAELTKQKNRIADLIVKEKNLGKAREELKTLKAQLDQYIAENAQLRQDKEQLTSENTQLTQDKQILSSRVQESETKNQELSSAKATLISEKQALETEKERLNKKVNVGSVVKTNNISVQGMKVKDSGKEVKKSYARNIERLKICFDATANQVVEAGKETFYVQVIDPLGQTLAEESRGAGIIKSSSDNSEVRYTTKEEINYKNDSQTVCINWDPSGELKKGQYKVRVFNKGYLAGESTVSLK
ncbi:MAG: hypothetical protein KA974_03565 [Saprospiraceae bacterium]|nr:hypothetical protein [Saprospiraceae bacterium]MBP7680184.1 hypothetical protein [Saprospiraceae bacterium]